MGTYELDDDFVRKFIEHQGQAGWGSVIADKMALVLQEQLPIPVPTKIGAVVRTVPTEDHMDGTVFVRWSRDSYTHSPWIEAGNHEAPYRTDEIGRIVEVLAPGVDL